MTDSERDPGKSSEGGSPEERAILTDAVACYLNIARWLMRDVLHKLDDLPEHEQRRMKQEGKYDECRWLESRGKIILHVMDAEVIRIPVGEGQGGARAILMGLSRQADRFLLPAERDLKQARKEAFSGKSSRPESGA